MRRFLTAALACLLALAIMAGCGGGTHKAVHARTASAVQSAMGSVHPAGWGVPQRQLGSALAPPNSGPTAEMFDTITLSTVPGHPFALAGYTAGFWPTFLPLRRAYPAAHIISIAISAGLHADCLDVEPGDAQPWQAGPWARADIAAGFSRPCLYSNASEMPAVTASLAASGLARSRYLLWLAWYRYVPGLIAGYDAVQWTDRALGRNLDESTVTLAFLTIAQPPYVTPKPAPVLPVCFTHRTARAQCTQIKARLASYQRAAASSERAYQARGCDVLKARELWFASAIRRQPRSPRIAHRKGALSATRRAEARLQCSLFASRAGLYRSLIQQTKASN